jgi:hypothetical protein
MKKNKFTFLTVALLLGTALSFGQTWKVGAPYPADVVATLSNGTLTVSGTGKMEDFIMGDSPFRNDLPSVKKIVIENGVTHIGALSFIYARSLEEVVIPGTLVSIGNQAFLSCNALKTINFPNTLENIESSAFFGCGMESITIPSGKIGTGVFSGCPSLRTVIIGAGVTFIGSGSFNNCQALKSITIASDNRSYVMEDSVLYTFDHSLLHTYPSWKTNAEYSVPAAFAQSVKRIGNHAFMANKYLKKINLPPSLDKIGWSAFAQCLFDTIVIPASVTRIDTYAFDQCENLISVTVKRPVPPSVYSTAFNKVDLSKVTLTVPAGAKALYEAANIWKNFGKILENTDTSVEQIPANILIHANGNNISIDTPSKEEIEIYTVSGALLYKGRKAEGATNISLNKAEGVIFVKGNGWTRKMIIK